MKTDKSGFSLIEVLTAVAIIVTAVLAFSTQISQAMKMRKHLELRVDIGLLVDYLRTAVDCNQTLDKYKDPQTGIISCPQNIDLFKNDGSTLQAPGKWSLKSECSPASIVVRAQKSSTSGQPELHPIYNSPLDYTNTLINPIAGPGSMVSLCKYKFNAASRVAIVKTKIINLGGGLVNASCSKVLPDTPRVLPAIPNPAPGIPFDTPDFQSIRDDYATYTLFDTKCSDHCRTPAAYAVGGYFVDCDKSTGDVSCACYR